MSWAVAGSCPWLSVSSATEGQSAGEWDEVVHSLARHLADLLADRAQHIDRRAHRLLLGALLCLYLIPWFVAAQRENPRWPWILALNLTLGWTGVGWLAALYWALQEPPPSPPAGLRVIQGGRSADDEPERPDLAQRR